jgi:hypothetical protein
MAPPITCPRCGWSNHAAARVCGGCGQALRALGSPLGATQTVPLARPLVAGGASIYGALPDAPTQVAAPVWPGAARRAEAPPPARRRSRAGSCLLRGLLGVAIALVVVVALVAAAWELAVRPYVHAQVDGAIGNGLSQAVASIPPIPDQALKLVGAQFSVNAADVNAMVVNQLPRGSGLDGLSVAFEPGTIELDYNAFGQPGAIRTTLRVQNDALVANQTQVSGPLGWVESGDELQATLDQALAQLRNKTPHGFQSVAIQAGQLIVVLKT